MKDMAYKNYDDDYEEDNDDYYLYTTPEEREAERKEREIEDRLERAFNCTCGAYSRKTGAQVADCYCGAE